MLKEMQSDLQKEADNEEELYEKMTCYCDSNEKEKSKAISDAENHIAELTSTIESNSAKSASLTTEVETLAKEIAANKNALEEATEMRAQARDEFNTEEKNFIVQIDGLKTAVMVLGKQHPELLQKREILLQVQNTLKQSVSHKLFSRMLTHKQRKVVKSLLKEGNSFLQMPAGFMQSEYAPASGEIFGILKQMKEEFEGNYAQAQKDEKQAVSDFGEMKATKNEEISAGTAKKTTKETEIANADEAAATAKEDLAATTQQLNADTEFLANLKVQCEALDKEFAERSKTRSMEMAAISEAIGIITEDEDANEMMRKTMGFVQLKSTSRVRQELRAKAASTVMAAAKAAHNPKVALLAVSMKLADFTEVKAKVQKMIDDLVAEKAEEIKTKDKCKEDLHKNGMDTTARYGDKEDLETEVASLEMQKSTVADELKVISEEVAALHIDMKRASETREAENKEFQQVVQEQRITAQILQKALDRLKEFYALVQTRTTVTKAKKQAPNAGSFQPYKKSEKSGGAMAMIENVIEDAKDLEAEAEAAEQDAQVAYETFISDSNASLEAYAKSTAEKTAFQGTVDETIAQTKGDLKSAEADISDLENVGKQLHYDCDFVLQNFDIRQEARDQEVQALKSSINMLDGMQ